MQILGFTNTPAQLGTSAATLYTSTSVRSRIDAFTLTNPTVTNRTATIYKMKSGGTATDTTTIAYQITVLAGQSRRVYELEGHWLESGDFIQGLASAISAISVHISGIIQS